jgi:drug/metabolite transporter (DMT)-like permease
MTSQIALTDQIVSPRAAGYIIVGMATLGLNDNFIPHIASDGSLWQFHLLRGTLALMVLCAIATLGWGTLRPKRPWAVFGRSLFQAGSMLIYFGCLAILPIGIVVAGLFTSPIFVLLIAMIFQGKRVGWVRSLSIIMGFAGAILVIRPDPAALDLVVFLPMLAGLLYAIGAIATRAWCEGESTLTLSAGFFAMLALFGAVGCLLLPAAATGAAGFAKRGWMPLNADLMFWIVVQTALALVGIFCLFRGYQVGEASHVAVYEYSLLIFASGWAWYLWGDLVSPVAMVGMALIALAGIIIVARRSV